MSPKCILVTAVQEMCSHFWVRGRHDRDSAGWQAEVVVSGPFFVWSLLTECCFCHYKASGQRGNDGTMTGCPPALGHWQHLLLQPHCLRSQQIWPWHLHQLHLTWSPHVGAATRYPVLSRSPRTFRGQKFAVTRRQLTLPLAGGKERTVPQGSPEKPLCD